MDSLRSTRLLKVPTNLLQLNSEVKVKKTKSSVKERFLRLREMNYSIYECEMQLPGWTQSRAYTMYKRLQVDFTSRLPALYKITDSPI
jgi:hypothetical protein